MTLRTLRRALEDAATDDEPVVIKGPLSDAFTQSLNEVYTKTPEGGEAVATESQANDVIAMTALARAISNQVDPEADNTPPTVFAVNAAEVTDQDVIALTQDMIDQSPSSVDDYALVLDTTTPEVQAGTGVDQTGERFIDIGPNSLASAMESIAISHGIKVYRSLEAYAIDRYIR